MRGMRGTRGMFTRIPGNFFRECYYFNVPEMFQGIPGNVEEDSGKWSRGFRRIFKRIPGNVQEDSWECSRGFWGMFKRIPGNAQEDFGEC